MQPIWQILKSGFASVHYLILLLTVSQTACKKQVDVDTPFTLINAENVYNLDATAIGVMSGVYGDMGFGGFATGINSISLKCGLSADELQGSSATLDAALSKFYLNALDDEDNLTFWEDLYKRLYTVNAVLEGLVASQGLTLSVKQQLTGEAKFMRAFINYYLVNLYGDVPLVMSTDYKTNSRIGRTDKSEVYVQIIKDLTDAKNLLSSNFLDADLIKSTVHRVRPTKWAAAALLARCYLFSGDWANAEKNASEVLQNVSLFDTVLLSDAFLANSKEAIWQLQPIIANENTKDGVTFILNNAPDYLTPVFLSEDLLNAFESGDNRKLNWVQVYSSASIDYHYPFKYKVGYSSNLTEYLMVLRTAEQYLIRSEARVRQNKLVEAQEDLNVIRKRAGLPNTMATDEPSLLSAILQERRVELFTEWGHRWLDLKRTGNIDFVMTTAAVKKGGNWNAKWQWYPIPRYDLNTNMSLTQTPGY